MPTSTDRAGTAPKVPPVNEDVPVLTNVGDLKAVSAQTRGKQTRKTRPLTGRRKALRRGADPRPSRLKRRGFGGHLPPVPHPEPAGPSGRDPAARPRPGPALLRGPSPHRPGLPRQAQASARPPRAPTPAPSRAGPAGAAGAVRARPRGLAGGLTCGGGGRARAAGGDRSAAHNEPLQRRGPAPAPPADTHWLPRARAPRAIGSCARPSSGGRGRSLRAALGRGAGPGPLRGGGSGRGWRGPAVAPERPPREGPVRCWGKEPGGERASCGS